jgi:hypothetical protein
MIRIYFILFLLFFVSCETNEDFTFQNSYSIDFKIPTCITKNDCFCFSSDSNLFSLMMYYSDAKCEEKKLIETVEFSPYNSTVHSFKSQKDNSYVVLWETEYEYIPIIQAYYIFEGRLMKIGELEISLPCQSCESFQYPIKEIKIFQRKEEIEISFLNDVNYRATGSNEWKLYKAGTLKYRFNKKTNELKHIRDAG